ncbi:MAG: methyltransferase [Paracoccaceae bacterium]
MADPGMTDPGLTCDGFLGGRLSILQPRTGYRAATDPVLLAAAVPARAGQNVLELGCGVGVASLCLLTRLPGLSATGIERQPDYADLARRNAAAAGLPLTVGTADLGDLPASLRRVSFDHVLANPPYFRAGDGTGARDPGREGALREETPLSVWTDAALRRLAPGGWLTMIHLAERLGDLLAALDARAGSVAVLPIAPRLGRPATRVILRARKGGRAPLRLLAPLVLHDGAAHLRDGDDYSAAARAVLRYGQPLPGFD